jgi:selenocysteine lyase/cysteine desulfurase
VYCDNASTVHKPKNDYIEKSYSNIHRGAYALAETSELLYKNSKKKVAQLI